MSAFLKDIPGINCYVVFGDSIVSHDVNFETVEQTASTRGEMFVPSGKIYMPGTYHL